MFGPVKAQMKAFFGYYEKKFKEECDVAMEVYGNDEYLVDLIIGQKTSNIFGAIISQNVPGTDIIPEESEEEESSEEEGDEDEDEEEVHEGYTIDYNMVRFMPEKNSDFQFSGVVSCEGEIDLLTDQDLKMTFKIYTQPATDPDPDDPENEIIGFIILLNDEASTKLYFKEDPALDELF